MFRFDHVDYTAVIPLLKTAGFGAKGVDKQAGQPVPPAADLGGLVPGAPLIGNPAFVNCYGNPVSLSVFMRTRYTGIESGISGKLNPLMPNPTMGAAGAAAYAAGTVVFYDCIPCGQSGPPPGPTLPAGPGNGPPILPGNPISGPVTLPITIISQPPSPVKPGAPPPPVNPVNVQ